MHHTEAGFQIHLRLRIEFTHSCLKLVQKERFVVSLTSLLTGHLQNAHLQRSAFFKKKNSWVVSGGCMQVSRARPGAVWLLTLLNVCCCVWFFLPLLFLWGCWTAQPAQYLHLHWVPFLTPFLFLNSWAAQHMQYLHLDCAVVSSLHHLIDHLRLLNVPFSSVDMSLYFKCISLSFASPACTFFMSTV